MPYSSHFTLTMMVSHAVALQPTSVLDIGAGYGKWGFLLREALDFVHERTSREEWQVRIDAIEAFPAYRSPLYEWVYDNVYIGDADALVDDLPPYDLVVLGDVLEHFTKADGIALLRRLAARSRNILISTPLDFFEQSIANNPYENHLSHWRLQDFSEWVFDYDVAGGFGMVVLLGGCDAVLPTARTRALSQALYRVPGLRRRGAAVRLIKQLLGSSAA